MALTLSDWLKIAEKGIEIAKVFPAGNAVVTKAEGIITDTIVPAAKEAGMSILTEWLKKNWWMIALPVVAIIFLLARKK